MKRKAFGFLDLLLGLIVIGIIFMISMNTFKNTVKINGSTDTKSIQQHVDEQVNEIEKLRQQRIELEKNINIE